MLNRLPKDVVNIIYRKLHNHNICFVNDEYASKFEMGSYDDIIMKTFGYPFGYPLNKRPLTWWMECVDVYDHSMVSKIYRFSGDTTGHNLPKRYLLSSSKTDMKDIKANRDTIR